MRDFTLPTRCSSKSSLFWVVTQRWLVVVCRSFNKVASYAWPLKMRPRDKNKSHGIKLNRDFAEAILLILDAQSTETSNVVVKPRTKRKRAQNVVMLHLAWGTVLCNRPTDKQRETWNCRCSLCLAAFTPSHPVVRQWGNVHPCSPYTHSNTCIRLV
jgi:hypothetical protein